MVTFKAFLMLAWLQLFCIHISCDKQMRQAKGLFSVLTQYPFHQQ